MAVRRLVGICGLFHQTVQWVLSLHVNHVLLVGVLLFVSLGGSADHALNINPTRLSVFVIFSLASSVDHDSTPESHSVIICCLSHIRDSGYHGIISELNLVCQCLLFVPPGGSGYHDSAAEWYSSVRVKRAVHAAARPAPAQNDERERSSHDRTIQGEMHGENVPKRPFYP